MIEIHETRETDLPHLRDLWARGDVTRFVGFPDGLQKTGEEMTRWFGWLQENRPLAGHYSVYEDGVYCGESFYRLEPEIGAAALDAKLLPAARGRGLATGALTYAIFAAFQAGAQRVWADPHPENEKAIALCARLGLVHREPPPELKNPGAYYMERLVTDPPAGGCGGCHGGDCAHCEGR